MKSFLSLIIGFLLVTQIQAQVSNCSASPYPIKVTQPNGFVIEVKGTGTNMAPLVETKDGYSLIKGGDGYYRYAERRSDGRLIAGNSIVGANNAPTGLSKHLFYNNLQMDSLEIEFNKNNNPSRQLSWGFPSKGKQKLLVLMIAYPDLGQTYTPGDFKKFMNDSNYNGTGSFRDYYKQNSFNQFDLEADVMGWYIAPAGYKTYGRNSGNGAAMDLVGDAIDSAYAAGVDFSKYDNDGDGQVDGLLVIHSGPGAEEGSQLDYIWSHRSSLWGASGRFYNGVGISDYCIMPETRSYGQAGIGVYCHEFGHILGLPDLYDTDGGSAGLGNYSLMAGGCWNNQEKTPSSQDVWCKTQLDWVHPVEIKTIGNYFLAPSVYDSISYRINTSNSDEYFLLENRQNKGFDGSLPGHGLAIFHIDESIASNYPGSNDINADESHKGIDLEEADGQDDLDKENNRGDQGDLFPGYYSKTIFSPTSTPNSDLYSGKSSSLSISGITEKNDTIFFNFGAKPQAGFKVDITKGCAPFSPVVLSNSLFTNQVKWETTDTSFFDTGNPVFTFDTAGTFSIKQTVFDSTGTPLDSMVSNVDVYMTPTAEFDYTINGYKVMFTSQALNSTGYYWQFSNLYTSSQKNPTITFPSGGSYLVKLIARNQNVCRDTIEKTIELYSLGVNELISENKVDFSIFPNPGNASFQLKVTNSLANKMEIYNTIGALVFESKLIEGQQQIETKLAPGMYHVSVLFQGGERQGLTYFLK